MRALPLAVLGANAPLATSHTLPLLVHTVALGAGRVAVPSLRLEVSGDCHLMHSNVHSYTHACAPQQPHWAHLMCITVHGTRQHYHLTTEDTTGRPGACTWSLPSAKAKPRTTGEALLLAAARCTAPHNTCCTTIPASSWRQMYTSCACPFAQRK